MAGLKPRGKTGMEWEIEHFPMFTVPLEIFLQMTKVQEYEDLMDSKAVNSMKLWARLCSCPINGSANTIQIQSFSNL